MYNRYEKFIYKIIVLLLVIYEYIGTNKHEYEEEKFYQKISR